MMTRALVLIGGTERYHDLIAAGSALADVLLSDGIAATLSQDASILGDNRGMDYDVLLLYSQSKLLTQIEQDALDRFVSGGRGFVPLHAANVMGMPDHKLYESLVGSTFVDHERFARIRVDIVCPHPVTNGIQSFDIEDELYRVVWNGPQPTTLAVAISGATHSTPAVYTKDHGAGRICYIALGHDGRSWWHPCFRKLITQATRWAAGNAHCHEITFPIHRK